MHVRKAETKKQRTDRWETRETLVRVYVGTVEPDLGRKKEICSDEGVRGC